MKANELGLAAIKMLNKRITNEVFLIIQNDRELMYEYLRLVESIGLDSVNQAIGKYQGKEGLKRAIQEFQAIINLYPDSKLSENCHYWIAQSYFNLYDYTKALEGFMAVIDDTRFSHKDDDSSIMLGITQYKTGNTTEALIEFQKFIIKYPDSEYRNKVNYWIQRLS